MTAVVGVHKRSVRLLGGATAVMRGLHDGFWLGIASRDVLHAIDDEFYRTYRVFNADDWNGRGLLEWEAAAVDRFFTGRARLAVTGAGGGREVLALLRLGLQAEGFEPNPALVEVANHVLQAAGYEGRVDLVPRDSWPAGSTVYDGVIVGYASYMHIQPRARRIAFLRQARAHVEPGAPLLVSFLPRQEAPGYFRVTARLAGAIRRMWGGEPVELGDTVRPTFIHCFTKDEIQDELGSSGFEVVDYSDEPYGWAVARATP